MYAKKISGGFGPMRHDVFMNADKTPQPRRHALSRQKTAVSAFMNAVNAKKCLIILCLSITYNRVGPAGTIPVPVRYQDICMILYGRAEFSSGRALHWSARYPVCSNLDAMPCTY